MIDTVDFNRFGYVKRAFFAGKPGKVRKLCKILGFNPDFRVPKGTRSAHVSISEYDKIDRSRWEAASRFWESTNHLGR